MQIIITGCGKVGSAILRELSHSGHDIIAIDSNPEIIDNINTNYDVMALVGRGTDCDLLRNIDAGKADIFIATTNSDEANALSCLIAKELGAKHAVARIADTIYAEDTLRFIKNQLGIDIILNPPKLAGMDTAKKIKKAGCHRVMVVGGGRTGAFTALYLAKEDCDVILMEKGGERCDYLVTLLPESVSVIHGDGTDHTVLSEEGIRDMDAFVSVANIEEENILLCVYAKSCDVSYATARVRQKDFMDIATDLGVDDIISINDITATVIGNYVESLARR